MPTLRYDVLGIGNAIVDVLARVEDSFLARHDLTKGMMRLIDEPTADQLYGDMGPAIEISGGSAGNTAAGLASFGGRAAYFGKVKNDQLGDVFAHDLRAQGVTFESVPATAGPATARFHPGHARRRAHDEHFSRRLRESHGRRYRPAPSSPALRSPTSKAICGTGQRPKQRFNSRQRSPARPAERRPSRSPIPFASIAIATAFSS